MSSHITVNTALGRDPLQVMIVEDSPGVLASMEAIVESWRAVEVTVAGDSIAALSWIETLEHLDLLLCDVYLPGEKGGLAIAQAAVLAHPNAAIVIFSADLRSDIVAMSDRYSFLRKPFGREALIMQIDDAFIRVKRLASIDESA